MEKSPSEVGKVKIKEEGDKKEEVIVLHKSLIQKEEGSAWDWLEEFTTEWSETLITKKKKKIIKS